MLGRLNHVAIAVKDAKQAAKIYGGAFGAEISDAVPLPEHGVITVFVTLPNTKIEFIEPLGEASPIASRRSSRTASRCCSSTRKTFPGRWSKSNSRELRDGLQHLDGVCDLLRHLVGDVVPDAAVRRAQPARGRRGGARHRSRRAG